MTGSLTETSFAQASQGILGGNYVYETALTGSITVIKYDTDKNPLDGVTYTLYDADGNVAATAVTGESGTAGAITGRDIYTNRNLHAGRIHAPCR